MRVTDILSISFRNLTRRKMRTALTAFGVVIGVCSILVMVSIGIGLENYMTQQLASWGDLTAINVNNWQGESQLTDDVLRDIQMQNGVSVVTPYESMNINFKVQTDDGRYAMSWCNVYGIYPEAVEALGFEFLVGEGISVGDKPYSMFVGEQFAYEFRDVKKKGRNDMVSPWPDESGVVPDPFFDPMSKKYTLFATEYDQNTWEEKTVYEVSADITGVVKLDNAKWETRNSIFMDIQDLKQFEADLLKAKGEKVDKDAEEKGYTSVLVKCFDMEQVADVQAYIEGLGFSCYSMETQRQMMREQMLMVQLVLGGLAAISLFVAAIGIANTMVMSIIERTREIGVMKVIGAEVGNIRLLFLLEAGMIGLLGGLVGVGASLGISYGINQIAGNLMSSMGDMAMGGDTELVISIIPWWLILFALGFSMLVGVVFGFLPANRAVKISALEAIKHD